MRWDSDQIIVSKISCHWTLQALNQFLGLEMSRNLVFEILFKSEVTLNKMFYFGK